MNLIGSRPDRWWNDPDGAVRRLIGELDRYAAATGDDVTVVFDRRPPDVEPGPPGGGAGGSGGGSTRCSHPTRIGRDRSDAWSGMGNLVLIADDDRDIVRFVALNLRLEGFEVVVADNGQDALDKALDVRPSLIVLDTMMPRMDGYEVCSRFRDQRPDSLVPVIMLTAKSLGADRAMAFTAGADDWMTKPFDPAELVSKVKDHLRAASTP